MPKSDTAIWQERTQRKVEAMRKAVPDKVEEDRFMRAFCTAQPTLVVHKRGKTRPLLERPSRRARFRAWRDSGDADTPVAITASFGLFALGIVVGALVF